MKSRIWKLPSIFEYTDVTWVAQDTRKGALVHAAHRYSQDKREALVVKATRFTNYVVDTLEVTDLVHYTRIQSILLQNHGPCRSVRAEQPPYPCDLISVHDNKYDFIAVLSQIRCCAAAWWRCLCRLSVTREAAWLIHRFPLATGEVPKETVLVVKMSLSSLSGGEIPVQVLIIGIDLNIAAQRSPGTRQSFSEQLVEDQFLRPMFIKEICRGLSNRQSIRGRAGELGELPGFIVPVWVMLDLLLYNIFRFTSRGLDMCMELVIALSDTGHHLVRCDQ